MGTARSNYMGVRATLTTSPDGETVIVTVSTKRSDARWDEWSALFPATITRRAEPIRSLQGALEELAQSLCDAADCLD